MDTPIQGSQAETIIAEAEELAELQQYRLAALSGLMSDISEECWCAGWLVGNENSLYAMAFMDMPTRYGMSEVDPDQLARLRCLAEQTGHWFYWDRDNGPTPIPLAEFAARFAQGMSGSAQDRNGLDPKDASPVGGNADAPGN